MSAPDKKSADRLRRERAARALLEAETIGNDRKAAEKLGITDRTIRNYRKALETDPQLAALFREHAEREAKNWHIARVRALRIANQRAVALLETETDLDKVTRFIEKTGGTDLAAEALGVTRLHSQQGSSTSEASGDPDAEDDDLEGEAEGQSSSA